MENSGSSKKFRLIVFGKNRKTLDKKVFFHENMLGDFENRGFSKIMNIFTKKDFKKL